MATVIVLMEGKNNFLHEDDGDDDDDDDDGEDDDGKDGISKTVTWILQVSERST